MKIENGVLKMNDGTRYYAHGGVVGISPDLAISQGWDGGINSPFDGPYEGDLSPEHRRELADHMIALWQRYRDAK